MPSALCPLLKSKFGFTLVEILSTVAIMAVLATLAMFFTANYVTWAKNTADAKTLEVLNDALTRYKCQGGNVNALTLGAPIGNVISRLQTPVDWAGMQHQFLQSGATYPGRSLEAVGERTQYRFTKYNTYTGETPAAGTATSSAPYGSDVGYASVTSATTFRLSVTATTGCWAYMADNGITTAGSGGCGISVAGANSVTFWPCVSGTDFTVSGKITYINFNPCSASRCPTLDLRGLSGLQSLYFHGSNVTLVQINTNAPLSTVWAQGNNLSASALNAIYSALPNRTSTTAGTIKVGSNPGTSSDTPSIATAKNWTVSES